LSNYNLATEQPLFRPIKDENKAYGQIQINKISSASSPSVASSPSIPIQMFPPSYEKEEQIKFQKKGPIQLATFFGYGIGGNYGRNGNDENIPNKIKFGREEESNNNDEFIDVTNNEKIDEKEGAVLV